METSDKRLLSLLRNQLTIKKPSSSALRDNVKQSFAFGLSSLRLNNARFGGKGSLSRLERLPREILLLIFEILGPKFFLNDLRRLNVSRRWRHVAEAYVMARPVVDWLTVVKLCAGNKRVWPPWTPPADDKLKKRLSKPADRKERLKLQFERLRELEIDLTPAAEGFQDVPLNSMRVDFYDYCTRQNWEYRNECLSRLVDQAFASSMPNMRKLKFSLRSGPRFNETRETRSLAPQLLQNVLANAPALQVLEIDNVDQNQYPHLYYCRAISRLLPQLRVLRLRMWHVCPVVFATRDCDEQLPLRVLEVVSDADGYSGMSSGHQNCATNLATTRPEFLEALRKVAERMYRPPQPQPAAPLPDRTASAPSSPTRPSLADELYLKNVEAFGGSTSTGSTSGTGSTGSSSTSAAAAASSVDLPIPLSSLPAPKPAPRAPADPAAPLARFICASWDLQGYLGLHPASVDASVHDLLHGALPAHLQPQPDSDNGGEDGEGEEEEEGADDGYDARFSGRRFAIDLLHPKGRDAARAEVVSEALLTAGGVSVVYGKRCGKWWGGKGLERDFDWRPLYMMQRDYLMNL